MSDLARLSVESVVTRYKSIVEAEVDSEVFALNIDTGSLYGLNKVGSQVWNMIAAPHRVGDVCATLLSEYEVTPDTCERDVLDLLNELRDEGLVEVVTAAPAPGA